MSAREYGTPIALWQEAEASAGGPFARRSGTLLGGGAWRVSAVAVAAAVCDGAASGRGLAGSAARPGRRAWVAACDGQGAQGTAGAIASGFGGGTQGVCARGASRAMVVCRRRSPQADQRGHGAEGVQAGLSTGGLATLHAPHVAPLLCDPLTGSGDRHAADSGVVGSSSGRDDIDLHPRDTEGTRSSG